jgi:large subunit ribosomal protein L17
MKHLRKGRKFGRVSDQRKALIKNLIKSFFINDGRITTTLPKAKEIRPRIEKIITRAKNNTDSVAAKRQIYKIVNNHKLVKKIFEDVAPAFKERKGGYTRIYKLGKRAGDAAEMGLITLLQEDINK